MPPKRLYLGGRCKHGHELTPDTVIIRADRNNCLECKTCQRRGRRDFDTRKPLYNIWQMMLRRCDDPNFKDWHLYGGKTPPTTICQRWRESYDAFEADMGARPSPRHTIDRIDSHGHYEPGNCRWATPKQQARNMSRNRYVTHEGQARTLAEWAERTGIPYMALFYRFERGWSIGRALTAPYLSDDKARARNRTTNHRVEFQGETLTIAEWAERYGMTTNQLAQRLRQGWTMARAVSKPMRSYRH